MICVLALYILISYRITNIDFDIYILDIDIHDTSNFSIHTLHDSRQYILYSRVSLKIYQIPDTRMTGERRPDYLQ